MGPIIDDLWLIIHLANDDLTCGTHDEKTRMRFTEISQTANRAREEIEKQATLKSVPL